MVSLYLQTLKRISEEFLGLALKRSTTQISTIVIKKFHTPNCACLSPKKQL